MRYDEYEKALSKPRLDKYKIACNENKNKALILYRYNDWLITQAQSGFIVNYQDAIFKERDKLINSNNYTHDKLVASLSLGVWTFMFSKKCYKNAGKTLLQIFPKKIHGLNQKDIYDDLDKIRLFRNRIAHHEPLCFNRSGRIYMDYVQRINNLLIKYIEFMGHSTDEFFYGVETPSSTIIKIRSLETSI
jgi:hypothetical protein